MMLQKLTSELLSLFLMPFSLGHRPKVGLVLKGSVDDVRQVARRALAPHRILFGEALHRIAHGRRMIAQRSRVLARYQE